MRCIGIVFYGRSTVFGELPSAGSVETGENDKKTVDQTGAENCTDLFRVHVLRGCGLTEDIRTTKTVIIVVCRSRGRRPGVLFIPSDAAVNYSGSDFVSR